MLKFPLFLFILLMMPLPALAYMGPGAGITAIGCLIALVAGLWYTLKGFLWLPLKRLLGFGKDQQQDLPQAAEQTPQTSAQAQSAKLEDSK